MDITLYIAGAEYLVLSVFALGSCVGLVAGMFGVGGGFLLIPLLHVVLGVPLPIAIGSGLCQTIATAMGSTLRYRKMGHAELRFDLLLLGGAILGVSLGARLLAYLSSLGDVSFAGKELPLARVVISLAYILLFCSIALILWFRASRAGGGPGPLSRIRIPPYINLPTAGLPQVSAITVCYVGLFNGTLSGLLGIGGGVVLIPIMLYAFGFDIRKSAGTGILMVLVVAITGTIQHGLLGNVHLGLAVTLMTGSALAAQVGASLTRSLPAIALRRGLALVILGSNAALLFKLLG